MAPIFVNDNSIIASNTYFLSNNDQNISTNPDLWLTFNSNEITSNKGFNKSYTLTNYGVSNSGYYVKGDNSANFTGVAGKYIAGSYNKPLNDLNYNVLDGLNPNLWLKFDTGAITSNSGTDTITVTNNNSISNANFSIRGNNSASFDGINQALSGTLDVGIKSWSIATWLYPTINDINGCVITFGNTLSANQQVSVGRGLNKTSCYSHNNLQNEGYTDPYPNDINNWVHIVWTYDSITKKKAIFRNGIKQIINGADFVQSDPNINSFLSIGTLTGAGYYYKGNMDDLRVYVGTVLTQDQINAIYYNNTGNTYTTYPIIKYEPLKFANPTVNDPNIDIMPIIWYKFDDSTNIGLDTMRTANALKVGTTPIPTYDNTSSVRGSGSIKSVAGKKLLTTYNFSDIIDAFTISFWVKINALGTSYDTIVAGNPAANQGLFYMCRTGGGSDLEVILFGSASIYYTGLFVADNIWKYLTITAEKVGTNVKINLYLNGVFYSTSTSGTWSLSGLTGFTICSQSPTTTSLLGNLDDMRIYNKVLTQDQITAIYYNANTNINYTTTINETLKFTTPIVAIPDDNGQNISTMPNLWCKFETGEITINSGIDTITLANNGTITNSNVSVRGNNSASFDGTSQYLSGTIEGIANNSFSVSVWLYSKNQTNGIVINFGNEPVIEKGLSLGFGLPSANVYWFDFYSDTAYSTSSFSSDINNWVHIIWVYNNLTKERSIYRNGVKLLLTDNIIAIGQPNPNNTLKIGCHFNNNYKYNGYIDDLRVYKNTVLTQEEINAIYYGYKLKNPLDNGQNISTLPNLWCQFESGSLTINDGADIITLTNNGSAPNAGVSVRGNNSISFNGTSQYLSGTIEGIANNSFSISAWLYSKTGATTNGTVISIGSGTVLRESLILGFGIVVANTYWFGVYSDDTFSTNSYAGDVNNWVHITWVYDATTKERMIYRNGVKLQATYPISLAHPNPNNILKIGQFNNTVYYNGYIDDLRVYTGRVLTQVEINAIYYGYKLTNPVDNRDANISTLPIIWYKFDDSGNVGLDSMGKANLIQDGTNEVLTYNSLTSVRGNGSIESTGVKTLITNYNFSDIVNAMSISFWVKITSLSSVWDVIMLFYGIVPNQDTKLHIGRNNNTSNFIIVFFGSGSVVNTHLNGEFIGNNIWKYFTFTVEKSGTAVKITSYLNGIFNATSTTGTWDSTGITSFNLSNNTSPFNGLGFNGNLDDFRMYNKVLTQAEINAIYYDYKITNSDDNNEQNISTLPTMWYTFDNNLLDISGNGNHLVLTSGGYTFSLNNYARGNGSIKPNYTNCRLVSTNNYTISDTISTISVALWYKIIGLNTEYDSIIYSPGTLYMSIQRFAATNRLRFIFAGGSLTPANNYYLADNIWHHVVMIGEKVGTTTRIKCWIDGVFIESNGDTGNGTWAGYTEKIGVLLDSGYTPNCYLDDLRVYVGKVLTQEEINAIYYGYKFNYSTTITEPTIGQDLIPNLWCKFDKGEVLANNGKDIITLVNNGTVINANFSVRGNDSASFNGVNQYLSGTIAGIANSSFSVSAWLYSKTGAIGKGVAISFGNVASNKQCLGLGFAVDIANVYYFGFYVDDAYSTSTFADDINNWVHITWVYDSNTKERMIYRNGVKLALKSAIALGQPNPNNILTIGKGYSNLYYFNGYIDDLRVYTGIVLSQTQISYIYNLNLLKYTIIKNEALIQAAPLDNDPNINTIPNLWCQFETGAISVNSGTDTSTVSNTGIQNANVSIRGNNSANFTGAGGNYIYGTMSTIGTKSWSISVWVYPTTATNAEIMSSGANVAFTSFVVGYGKTNVGCYIFTDGNTQAYSSSYSGDVNSWVYLVYIYNAVTLERSIYRNGVKLALTNPTVAQSLTLANDFGIGIVVSGSYWKGYIDDLRFYTGKILTQVEITRIYNGTKLDNIPIGQDLIPNLWCKFDTDEITINSGKDVIILVNNNSAKNSGVFVKGTNAISLDGISQYLTGNINGISGNSWSVSCWLYSKRTDINQGVILSFGNVVAAYKQISVGYSISTAGVYTHKDGNSEGTSAAFLNDINNWVHLVWIYDANNKTRYIYRNGVNLPLTGSSVNGQTDVNTTIMIGYGRYGSVDYYYNGFIDDLQVYTGTVLSQNQVNCIYKNTYINYPINQSNETLTLSNTGYNDPNIYTIPNLWCRFDTGALTTNSGIDNITLTNNGTAINSGISVRGNNSISLNGTSQYLTGIIDGIANNSFSISFWVYSRTGETLKGTIITIGTDFTNNKLLLIGFGINTANTYNFGFYGDDSISVSYLQDINNWVHIVTIYNSITKERCLYRNGVKIEISNAIAAANLIPNTILRIGSYPGNSYYFNGNIDDLRIYKSKVLTQEEITSIYTGAITNYNTTIINPVLKPALTPNLWCKFDTGALTVNSGSDVITLVNNGTATNTGISVRGNNSISFNGTSQYLSGTIEGIANNSFSVSAWLYSTTGAVSKGVVISFGTAADIIRQALSLGFGVVYLNKYWFGFYNDDSYSTTAFANDNNNWVHITWIYNSNTKERMIYRNGIKLELTGAIALGQPNPNNIFRIGQLQNGYNYQGYIDDIRVYTGVVLTQEQINDLYTGNAYTYSTLGSQNTLTTYQSHYNSWSISAWIFPTNITNGEVVAFGNDSAVLINGYGKITAGCYFMTDSIINAYSSDYSSDINTWVYIVFMFNAFTYERSIYRNGVKLALTNPIASCLTTINSYLGGVLNAGNYWKGNIDDLRVYTNKILTQSEITRIYNGIKSYESGYNNMPVTSNVLLNAISAKQDINLPEQKYPSRNYNSISTITGITYLGQSAFTQSFTLNDDGLTNDNGTYNIFYNSYFSDVINPSLLFNDDVNDHVAGGGHWAINKYTNGIYNNTLSYIVSDYYGDWVIIKLPKPIKLTKYNFYIRSTAPNRAPGLWKIYGSNDGTTWEELINASNLYTVATYTNGVYSKTNINNLKQYLYYGLTVYKLVGSDTVLNFSEWQIFGIEKTSSQADWNTTIVNKPYLNNITQSYITGNVGIGTNSPSNLLHIHSNATNSAIKIQLTDTTTGINLNSGFIISKESNQDVKIMNCFSNANMIFGTSNTERMRINSNGNVGIGSNNPQYKLDVNGIVNATDIYKNGQIFSSSQWLTSNANIYYLNGSIGIGTNSPSNLLHIHSNAAYSSVKIQLTDTTTGVNSNSGLIISKESNEDARIINYFSTGAIYIGTNNCNSIFISSNGSVGIGTTDAIGGNGYLTVNNEIRSKGDVIAYFSDMRLKTKISNIINPFNIINNISGIKYTANDLAIHYGLVDIKDKNKEFIGVSAQEVKQVLPEIVSLAPFDMTNDSNDNLISKSGHNYLTIKYDKLVPVLIEGLKELKKEVLFNKLNSCYDFIPNIYKFCKCQKNIIITDYDISEILKIGDKIKIISNDTNNIYIITSIINKNTFEINNIINNNDVFVYGTYIKNIEDLDNKYLLSLINNTSDELYKILNNFQNNITETKELKERLEILEKQIKK